MSALGRSESARPAVGGAVLLVFLLSGSAALIYEVLWTRWLSLIFGVTTYAAATVLATYMAGLALGSWLFGRWIDRGANPLRVYALLEAGIAVYALGVPALFDAVRPLYVELRSAELPYGLFAFTRALLAGLLLLLPTTLMGGTFPVLVRFFARRPGDVGGTAGVVYAVNTAGAVAGCVAAGFFLIGELGLTATTGCAVGVNLACAGAALALAPFAPMGSASGAEAAPGTAPPEGPASSRAAVALALFAIGVSGFAALAYEVVWTRALLRYLHNSVYAFTTMLTTFLAGIALGSALYSLFLRRSARPLRIFAVLELGVGLGFLGSAQLFAHLPGLDAAIRGTSGVSSFGQTLQSMTLMSMAILFAPALLLGAALPVAVQICAPRLATVGASVGRVYAVNTLGSILGSLGGGFVLVPLLGMQGALALLIALNVGLAGALAAADLPRRRIGLALATAGALGAVALALPADLFRRTFALEGEELVFYREGVTDTVAVVEKDGQRRIRYEDHRGTAGTFSYPWNFFLGHLPLLLHPGEPRTVLHICFGVGNSLSAVAAHDSVERVDNVELSPHILEAAPYFWTNADVIHHPKVRTLIDDGRNFVMTTSETYDVIALEPPLTFTAGVINLYTREFYADAARRLAPDGLLMQWLPVGETTLDDERMIFRALRDALPHATAWRHHPGGPLLLFGAKEPFALDYQRLRARMGSGRVRSDLDRIGIADADHLLSYFVFDEEAFAAFSEPAAPVTDDKTVIDFRSPYHLGSGFGLGAFSTRAHQGGKFALQIGAERERYYLDRRRPIAPYLTNLGGEDRSAIAARIAARFQETPEIPPPIPESEWRRW